MRRILIARIGSWRYAVCFPLALCSCGGQQSGDSADTAPDAVVLPDSDVRAPDVAVDSTASEANDSGGKRWFDAATDLARCRASLEIRLVHFAGDRIERLTADERDAFIMTFNWSKSRESEPANVWRVPLDGAAASRVGTSKGTHRIALTRTHVAWNGDNGSGFGDVKVTSRTIANESRIGSATSQLAVAGDSFVWALDGSINAYDAGTGVRKIATGSWTTYAMAADKDTVFWFDLATSKMLTVPLAGGVPRPFAPEAFATESRGVGAAAVAAGRLYWSGRDAIRSRMISGGDVAVLSMGEPNVYVMHADNLHLYWLSGTRVRRARLDGTGDVSDVVTCDLAVEDFAITPTDVFFASGHVLARVQK